MLVVNGFLENGVFIPEKTITNITGRQKASLRIEQAEGNEKQVRIEAWREFSRTIRSCNEELDGEPERINFRTPEQIEAL